MADLTRERITCPKCEGRGFITPLTFSETPAFSSGCDKCCGSGYVVRDSAAEARKEKPDADP